MTLSWNVCVLFALFSLVVSHTVGLHAQTPGTFDSVHASQVATHRRPLIDLLEVFI